MKAKIGCYCRISTLDKQPNGTRAHKESIRQWAKSNHVPASELRWYEDRITGTTTDRPQLQKLLWGIDKKRIDVLVVFKLDRLARDLRQGIGLIADLADKGVRVVSVSENIDFGSSTGRLIASILLACSQFERENIVSRIRSGVAAAKAQGIHCGRPRDDKKLAKIRKMKNDGLTVIEISERLTCSRQDVYSALAKTA
jgi:DNA invertase Pin-like site-specific DNA recombinase